MPSRLHVHFRKGEGHLVVARPCEPVGLLERQDELVVTLQEPKAIAGLSVWVVGPWLWDCWGDRRKGFEGVPVRAAAITGRVNESHLSSDRMDRFDRC